MRIKLVLLLGLLVVAPSLTYSCDDRDPNGCIATPPPNNCQPDPGTDFDAFLIWLLTGIC